jgi:hypothetical protein
VRLKSALLLAVALVLPACHDDDHEHQGGGPLLSRNPGGTTLGASLSGGQQAPRTLSFGSGGATFFIPSSGDRVDFTLDTRDLSGATSAQVQLGRVGVNGPVLFDLSTAPFVSPLSGTLRAGDLRPQPGVATFDDAVNALIRGDAFVNVRSTAFPNGEIRGQIGPVNARASLTGSQVVPGALTGGTGTATFALSEDQTRLTFNLDASNLSGLPTGASIHIGPVGANGPAVFDLSTTMFDRALSGTLTAADLRPQPIAGVVTFADAVDALLSGNAHVIVTTAALPAGEIRGQLVPVGSAAAPPVAPSVPPISNDFPPAPAPVTPVTPVVPVIPPVGAPIVLPVQNTGLPPVSSPSVPPSSNLIVPATTPAFAPVTNPAIPPFTMPSAPQGSNLGVPATTPVFAPVTNPAVPPFTVPVVPATRTTVP